VDQAWLSVKPLSVLKLFLFRCISVAVFVRRSKYPGILSNIEVPLCLLLLIKYYLGDQIKKTEMGRACSMYGGEEK
jgi:hypothetical protein